MFEPSDKARIYAAPAGVDFLQALQNGLHDRLKGAAPHDWARVEIYVNTGRMQRRLRSLFQAGNVQFVPRIRLITDLAQDAHHMPAELPDLRRRLELTQLIRAMLVQSPSIAPPSAAFDLSNSLATLLGDAEVEGVGIDKIAELDVSDESGYWGHTLEFIRIVRTLYENNTRPSRAFRQRSQIAKLAADWQTNPPSHPIIVAGSTGSRGTTFEFMKAVAMLPNGAVVLPGFDFSMPDAAWDALGIGHDEPFKHIQDHPQYQFGKLIDALALRPHDVKPWGEDAKPKTLRSDVVSLSLRPAPVTNHWMEEGARLPDIAQICDTTTWLEAKDPKGEAAAIAMRLRHAAQLGEKAAVITPDRSLARRISAALLRWNIIADDSAGTPLKLSAAGRLFQHVLDLAMPPLSPEKLIALLKHPLTHAGDGRGEHLQKTRDLELFLRKSGPAFLDPATLHAWAKQDDTRLPWVNWLIDTAFDKWPTGDQPISAWLHHHIAQATRISTGRTGEDAPIWAGDAGAAIVQSLALMQQHGDALGDVSLVDYAIIISGHLAAEEVRENKTAHPDIHIWGTLEARVQGADLVILAGLNEASWPEVPAPDPWLNRRMRAQAGLPRPEQRIGLSAHDYQQAMGAAEVWVTRSIRSSDAETVASRWLNRLENLLNGLHSQNGATLVKTMKAHGAYWERLSQTLDHSKAPTEKEPRPAACPPVHARPNALSVTEIKTLIRDPYAIYAKHVLRLRPLDPLKKDPDAALRGTAIHEILAAFLQGAKFTAGADMREILMQTADQVLNDLAAWPAARRLWRAKVDQFADWFLSGELTRQQKMLSTHTEIRGKLFIQPLDFTLTGTADRVDILHDGTAWIYDYKTGLVPSKPSQQYFDKQLLLEAEMIKRSAFSDIGTTHVSGASFVGLGSKFTIVDAPLDGDDFWSNLLKLLQQYANPNQGYAARRALLKKDDYANYDHLSRYGEWDTTARATKVVLK